MFKRLLGGILSVAMLINVVAPVFAAETAEVGAPRNVEVPAAATTYSSISILWNKPEEYKDITGYNVYMDGVFKAKTAANETYYTAEDLAPNSEHTFTVKSLVGETESTASNEVTARTDIKGTVRDVTDEAYGAKGDGTTNDTEAIQAAIDACSENDIVLLPEGKTFLSGALDLKSNMTLEVNGTLAGIQDETYYEKKADPSDETVYTGGETSTGSVYTAEAEKRLIWSRVEGWELYSYRSLINIGSLTNGTNYGETDTYNVTNVKIIGKGEITGSNNDYKTRYDPIEGQANWLAQQEGNSAEIFYNLEASNTNGVSTNNIRSRIRGRLINVSNAQNVYIKGVTVSRPPMWTVHMIYSDNITTNGVTFETSGYRNGDGWDPDSSSNCTIYDCDFHTGDDCVAIKSGKNPEGNEINRPAVNIKVISCRSNGGLGLAVGSEMSGGVEDVYVRDCTLSNTRYGVELKANKVRGGYIRNFNVQDSTIDQVLIHSVDYNADGTPADTPPLFSDIHFKNVNIISRDGDNKEWLSTPVQLDGFTDENGTDAYYIKDVTFEDITVGTTENVRQTISLKKCRNIAFNNVLQSNGKLPKYTDSDATFTVDGGEYVVPEPDFEGIKGSINEAHNTYTWEIGKAAAAEAGTTYSDSDKTYVELTVGLGEGDTMNADGINFAASSVRETNTSGQASVADTQRYLLVRPKYNGTMKVAIKFTSGTQTNNRIYYKDFADGSVDFSQCGKDSLDGMMTGSGIGANTEKILTLDMTAGHTYVLYTYQNSSTIPELTYTDMSKYKVTFDYGDNTVTRTLFDSDTVSDIPEPPSKDIIKLNEGHENSGVLIKAVYTQNDTLDRVSIVNNNVTLTTELTEYDLPTVNANEKYFLWNSLDGMKPLGVTDKKTAYWVYDNAEFTEDTVVTGDITVNYSYTKPEGQPDTTPTDNPDNPPAEKKTASITIKYVDEEQNKIKDDVTYTTEFTDGDAYSLPEEYRKNIIVKTKEGKYNYFSFNNGTSTIPAAYSENMTVTLMFNGELYDYYEDFEAYTLNASAWSKGAGCADPTLEEDNTKYVQLRAGSSSTGAYTTFNEINTEGKAVHITADVKFAPNDTTGEAQFSIANTSPKFSSDNINYGIVSSKDGHIITLAYTSAHKLLVNGKEVSGDGITAADFVDDWIHIDADADFGAETADITIKNSAGKTASFSGVNFLSSVVEGNIGAFYLRGAGSNGIAAVDNITVKITGEGGTLTPNIENPINLKTVYAFGDSIVYGHNYPETSFMRLIANDYAIKLKMMAQNGASIMPSSKQILTQIKNAPAAEPDFVVFEGYTNDAYGSSTSDPEFNPKGSYRDITQCYGEITAEGTTQFDENTFCGSFEKTIQTIKQKWPNSKVVFITIHKSGARNLEIQTKLRELSMQMCEKWNVDVVDMFTYVNEDGKQLDTTDSTQMYNYMIDHKGSHPNVAACREFYIPAVVEKLEALCGGGDDPSGDDPSGDDPSGNDPAGDDDFNAVATYKFDFGAKGSEAADGFTAVTPDMVYDMSTSDTAAEGEQFGFLGTTETSYEDDVISSYAYEMDNRAIDGFTVSKGQYIDLNAGGEADIKNADSDYIRVPKKEEYVPATASEFEGRYPIRFAMKAENGAYYTVTATLANASDSEPACVSLFSEKRHIIAEDVTIPAGKTITFKFNVDIETVFYKNYGALNAQNKHIGMNYNDDILNICVSGENAALSSLIVEKHGKVDGKIKGSAASVNDGQTIWLCTDSTGCDQPAPIPFFALQNYTGVGQALSKYMPENIAVSNQGEGGLASSDNSHFNNCMLKEGDYLYVEYGHNENGSAEYKSNLQKYYDRAKASGAYLIIVSPVNRCNEFTAGAFPSNFTGYVNAGKTFVEEKITEDNAKNIAFVDMNTLYTAWMNDEAAKAMAVNPSLSAMDVRNFYYRSNRSSSADVSHMNDAGADQGAYYFFEAAKAVIEEAEKSDATDLIKVQAEVIRPIVEGMKTKIADTTTDNLPMTLSRDYKDILLAGPAANTYWDNGVSDAVNYVNYADVSDVDAVTNQDGTITISSVTMRMLNQIPGSGYTKAVITVTDGAEETKYYTESNYDCTTIQPGGTLTNSGFIISDKDHTLVEDSDKTATITVPDGAECSIQILSCDADWVVGDNPEIYSQSYPVYPETAVLFEDGISDMTAETSAADGDSGWSIVTAASVGTATVKDDDGKYISLYSSGVTSANKDANYGVMKPLSDANGISSGRYRLSFKTRWGSGIARFTLSDSKGNSTNPFPNKTYVVGILSSGVVWANNEATNTLDISKTVNDETGEDVLQSKIDSGKWIDVDAIIDLDAGKMIVSAAGSEYKTFNVSDWRSNSPSTLPIKYFGIAGDNKGTPTTADIKDIKLVKIPDGEKAKVTASASVNDASYGAVKINGNISSAEVGEGDTVTFKAVAQSGYKFVNWTDSNGTSLSTSAVYQTRVFENTAITANFEALADGELIWDFAKYGDSDAITANEALSEQYDGLEIALKANDSITDAGIFWSATDGTGDSSVSSRYIKYTPEATGTISVVYSGSTVSGSNNPRMYLAALESASQTTKANGDKGTISTSTGANRQTTLTALVQKGKTYYIWPFLWSGGSCQFTVSSISFNAIEGPFVMSVTAKEGGSVTINGESVSSKSVDVDTEVTFTAIHDGTHKFTGWTNAQGTVVSTSYKYTVTAIEDVSLTANFEALAGGEKIWDFISYADNEITATDEQVVTDNTVSEMPLSIHLINGDKINGSGIFWKSSSLSNTSTGPINNKRYITFTAPSDGKISVAFSGTAVSGNNKPRLYMTVGDTIESMTKGSINDDIASAEGIRKQVSAINTPTTLEMNVTEGTTYSLWTWLYNNSTCSYTISSISFTPGE